MAPHDMIPLAAVVGPTATGKTALGVALAKAFNGEVVSADSMQIYRGMPIATAQPTSAEMDGVPHHLIGILEPREPFSVAAWCERARAIIDEIHARGKTPILVGGTGLYVSSLLDHVSFAPGPGDESLRETLRLRMKSEGEEALWRELYTLDPETAGALHKNNRGRVIRALEVYHLTGVTMTEHRRRSRLIPSPYRAAMVGLSFRDRQALYDRIEHRVDAMMEAGLLDEAREAFTRPDAATAGQAIGCKELFSYLKGACTLPEAVDALKRETRRYAKRQLTWFRRDERVYWLYVDDYKTRDALCESAARYIKETLGGD